MTNPKDKLSSIFKALAPQAPEIDESADELVQDEAQKWPLFKALAPKKPAKTAALTAVDKKNWVNVEPPPPQAAVADIFSNKLAAGLVKMSTPKKSAARKQVKIKKEDPQPQATRAKPVAKKVALAKVAKEVSVPLSAMPQEAPVAALKADKPLKVPGDAKFAPTPIPFPAVNRPVEPLAVASVKPFAADSNQVAVNPKTKKGLEESPVSGTQSPNVNSLLSLFSLDAPESNAALKAQPVTKEQIPESGPPTDVPEPHVAPPSGVRSALIASEPVASVHSMPVDKAPHSSAAQPGATAQTAGTLKSLLSKLQAPDAPSVKTPGFLNRLNKK